jgi:manganese oxidase
MRSRFARLAVLSAASVVVSCGGEKPAVQRSASATQQTDDADSCPAEALFADVVAIDSPMVFNRLGAQNVNWMMYALRHDVVDLSAASEPQPLDASPEGDERLRKAMTRNENRKVALRPDLRPRPLVLRVAAGGYLRVRFTNLLELRKKPPASHPGNPFSSSEDNLPGVDHPLEHVAKDNAGFARVFHTDNQVDSRFAGFHPQGLELVHSARDDSSFVGRNPNSLVAPGESAKYCFHAPEEGSFLVTSEAAPLGGEATSGNSGVGLFGAVAVQPRGARFYRAQVTEEELRLARTSTTSAGQPVVDYEARYPSCGGGGSEVWCKEGKGGLPILNMVDGKRIVHGDINALIVGPEPDGSFPASTYPLEDAGMRNPSLPNRLEPFREFVSVFHDENAAAQAFPYFFEHPELSHTLHGVRDAFMINYGSGGVGAEVIANRLQAGPMQDCLDCAFEEFFLSSFAVGDPALLVDNPVNLSTGRCQPEFLDGKHEEERKKFCVQGARATQAFYPHDPANVHHSYIGDFVKFRNVHTGKEQHVFHLHNHQWLFNANDDNSNYVDAQSIGPGAGYTYEIAFGGSGNRNKTVGDAIFHCHFYPHFAQGMWYLWRNHDVFESGTPLHVSSARVGSDGGVAAHDYHQKPWELALGRPATNVRALPDGEIEAGTPIPAIVPLPGKAMPPMPGAVFVEKQAAPKLGSKAKLQEGEVGPDTKNPGYPFWIAGVTEHRQGGAVGHATIGHRPTTPPLDMEPSAGGHNGGLPRHALGGFSEGGEAEQEFTRLSALKEVHKAKPYVFDEQGTPLEKLAMKFHGERAHASFALSPTGALTSADFITNGAPPVPGAPFNEPCIDDKGALLTRGGDGSFFSGTSREAMLKVTDALPNGIEYGATNPRIYKGANLQLDVVFNKLGYHYPQQRILTLWEDVHATLSKQRAPEPMVMRMNTFDCASYQHTNLIPKDFYADDYQITTPTDVIGQHIHLPKWDLTSADGSANGWNYEDGTFSPGAVRERIWAINTWNAEHQPGSAPLVPQAHPFFGKRSAHQEVDCRKLWQSVGGDYKVFEERWGHPGVCDWLGARTTLQRWFSDPVVNRHDVHRGLGTTFTHDHLGPSTHQQLGLYATMLSEPPGAKWHHNETGVALGTRADGGPTTWQAIISGPVAGKTIGKKLDIDGDGQDEAHREFFLEFADFQHAYQKDTYVGVNSKGKSSLHAPEARPTPQTFRKAINPSYRKPSSALFPDIVEFPATCPGGPGNALPGAVYAASAPPKRPCPETISADDVGMMVVNYRNEPVAARVFDPHAIDPTDKKDGSQKQGLGGDLAFALETRTDRACKPMNYADGNVPPDAGVSSDSVCDSSGTNTPYAKQIGAGGGDPFTPILRAYSGDAIRIKVQAGAHEHEHSFSVNGLAWLQGGSGYGRAPHSGWRNAQLLALSEQFTVSARVTDYASLNHHSDRLYAMDSSQDGLWSGVWGVLRTSALRLPFDRLATLPSNRLPTLLAPNQGSKFANDCPKDAPVRFYEVTAVLANRALTNDTNAGLGEHAGIDADGGTLVYNPRPTAIRFDIYDEDGGTKVGEKSFQAGSLHDPTAILFVRNEDLDSDRKLKPGRPVEPLVLRAAAGECIRVDLRNALPRDERDMPDLNGHTLLTPMVPRHEGTGDEAMTSFNNNSLRPSNHVGLHPQMLHYDVHDYDGNNVGINQISTVEPGLTKTYQWYAGNYEIVEPDENCPPEELGQLSPAFALLNQFGGHPDRRSTTRTYDAQALMLDFAEAVHAPALKAGGQNALVPGARFEPLALKLAGALESLGCLESTDGDLTADLQKQLHDGEPRAEAPLAKPDAMLDRAARLERRLKCAGDEQVKEVIAAAFKAYNGTPSAMAVSKKAIEDFSNRFVSDRPSPVDAGPSGMTFVRDMRATLQPTAARFELSPNTTRLVRFNFGNERANQCRAAGIEFGAGNLTPPDRIKQGQKAAVGALIVEPANATWDEYHDDTTIGHQKVGTVTPTRATADVTYDVRNREGQVVGQSHMRDLVVVAQKGLNLRFGNGQAVPNLAAEAADGDLGTCISGNNCKTAPEDAHDSGHMAINYMTEPLWFRFGRPPDAHFIDDLGRIPSAWQAFADSCCEDAGTATSASSPHGPPYAPTLIAYAGSEARLRMLLPTGSGRGTTWAVHGHVWARDPYLAEILTPERFPAGPYLASSGTPSKCIGDNPLHYAQGAQDSQAPMQHYDIVLPLAGGKHHVRADYLFRDIGGFGVTSGLWGILRVEPEKWQPTVFNQACPP